MKNTISISLLALLILPAVALGQDAAKPPDAPSSQTALGTSGGASDRGVAVTDPPTSSVAVDPSSAQRAPATAVEFGLGDKVRYYLTETYFNPSALTAPAFRAGLRMANPPGKRATQYPLEWKQGAEAFGRNYGDALAERTSFQTASDDGVQIIMFTHQSGSIWADMANIVWASRLKVTTAWYVVTETNNALREGSYVKGRSCATATLSKSRI
jgi:hypothetical protein